MLVNIDKINEEYEIIKLDNGLNVILYHNEHLTQYYAKIQVNVGSNELEINDRKYNPGIAHFLEHLMFASKDGDYFDDFSRNGASANAFTSNKVTSYYFTCASNFIDNLEILIKMVNSLYITDDIVDKELKIIKEEISMYDALPEWFFRNEILAGVCNKTNYGIDIAGKHSDIEGLTSSDFESFFNEMYKPNNQTLVISGNLEKNNLKEKIKEMYSNIEYSVVNHIIDIEDNLIRNDYETKFFPNLENKIVSYSLKLMEIENDIHYYIATEIIKLYFFNFKNPLFNELLEKQKLNETFYTSVFKENDLRLITFEMMSDNPEEFRDNIDYILQNTKVNIVDIIKILLSKEIIILNDRKQLLDKILWFHSMNIDINEFYEELFNPDINKIEENLLKICKTQNKYLCFLDKK